jgi:hypothetical protein
VEAERGVEQQRRQEGEQYHGRVELRRRHQVTLLDQRAAEDEGNGVGDAHAAGENLDQRRPEQQPGQLLHHVDDGRFGKFCLEKDHTPHRGTPTATSDRNDTDRPILRAYAIAALP